MFPKKTILMRDLQSKIKILPFLMLTLTRQIINSSIYCSLIIQLIFNFLLRFNMQQESIYNLIPKEYVPPPKEQMYKSRFPGRLPPTASTFNNFTTSRPKVQQTLLNYLVEQLKRGVCNIRLTSHSQGVFLITRKTQRQKTIRIMLQGTYKPKTTEFRLKQTGTMGSNALPEVHQFKYEDSLKRPPVPKKDEIPIHGLKSNKNYIVTNAVENILAAPKVMPDQKSWTSKKDYGAVPDYLTRIKDCIESEYKMIQNLHMSEAEEQDKQKFMMSKEEIDQLRQGLKKKWEAVNKEYQSITHINRIDTVGLKRKKENCERELKQLEFDIEKLNKQYIFVDTNK